MEVSDQLHAASALPRGKSPRYILDRKLGEPQSQYERGEDEKKIRHCSLSEIEPRSSSPYLVTILTELPSQDSHKG